MTTPRTRRGDQLKNQQQNHDDVTADIRIFKTVYYVWVYIVVYDLSTRWYCKYNTAMTY